MTITFALAILMCTALALALKRHGPNSLITLGVIGFFAYSSPALLDFHSPFRLAGAKRGWIETPVETDIAVLIAWLVLVPIVALRWRRVSNSGEIQNADLGRIHDLAVAGVVIILAGHAYLSWIDGILYFAQSREMQVESYVTLLWKWSIPLTLALSVVSRNKYHQAVVLFGVIILFLRGDRTMLAISLFVGILSYREIGSKARDLLSPKKLGLILGSSILLLVGKPIYLSAKKFFLTGTYAPIQSQSFATALASFEPIGTMYHLTFVIQNEISIPIRNFLVSVFGNLLIIPSIFNVDTNLYGETVTAFVGPGLTYGIAGSYLAHGYSVGGFVGVAIFAASYGLALVACDGAIWRSRAMSKAVFIVVGGTIAGYIHRNGLDNFGSFVRQIILMAIAMVVVAWLMRLVRGNRARSSITAHGKEILRPQ